MPLVDTDRINADRGLLANIAKWVFEYGRGKLAYQYVAKQVFVYKVPTLGQMLDLEVAEAQSPMVATKAFLEIISLTSLPRMKTKEVTTLMKSIVREHFPTGENGLRDKLLLFTSRHMQTMVGAVDTHLREIGVDLRSKDLTYEELLEILAIKQTLSQKPILKGSMPKQQKQRRGKPNVKRQRTE